MSRPLFGAAAYIENSETGQKLTQAQRISALVNHFVKMARKTGFLDEKDKGECIIIFRPETMELICLAIDDDDGVEIDGTQWTLPPLKGDDDLDNAITLAGYLNTKITDYFITQKTSKDQLFSKSLNNFVKLVVTGTEIDTSDRAFSEYANIHINRTPDGWTIALRPKSAGDESSDLVLGFPVLNGTVDDARIDLAGYISAEFARWRQTRGQAKGGKIVTAKLTPAQLSARGKKAVAARMKKYGQKSKKQL